jgi:hypothetical protein
MSVVDQNAEALRSLLGGPLLAAEVAARVGWEPRVAGQKLAALERQGFVVREIYKSSSAGPSDTGEKVVYRWRLAARGEAIASASARAAQQPDIPPTATEAPGEDPELLAAAAPAPVGREGLALRLEPSEWVLVLGAAQGAERRRAG